MFSTIILFMIKAYNLQESTSTHNSYRDTRIRLTVRASVSPSLAAIIKGVRLRLSAEGMWVVVMCLKEDAKCPMLLTELL